MKGVEFNWKDTLGYSNFGLLYTEENEADAFGRPSITWGTGVVSSTDPDGYLDTTLGEGSAKLTMREEIITDAKTADKVYVGEVKAEDIYKDLNMRDTILAKNLKIFENDDADSSSTETITKDDGDTKFGKDGQTVEIYYTKADDKTKDEVIMVITSTYLGVVVDDDYTQDNKDGVRIEVLGPDGGLKFCEATGYSEDDLVLVTISDDEIQAIVGKPDTVNGAVSRIGQKDGNTTDLTISGKKYPQSKEFDAEADGDVIKGTDNFEVKNTYTLYLDKNGNYLAAVLDEDNATTDLVYVYNVEKRLALSGENAGKYQAHAIVVYMDGTTKAVPLGDANISIDAVTLTSWTSLKGTLADLKYDEDDDEYTLTASGDYTSAGITQDVELKTDSRYAKFTAGGNTYLNDSTVYVFVAEKEGKTEIDSVKVITGGVDFDIDSSNRADSAFAVKTGKNVAEYVVIKAEYEAAVKDIVYIKSNTLKGTVDGGYTFEGYYNGSTEKVEIPVYSVDTNIVQANGTNAPDQGFYEYSEKSDGTLKLTDATAPADEDKSGAIEGKVIKSIEGSMLDITNGRRPYDISGLKFVDLTDKDDPDENTYEANVTTLSTLRRIVNGDYDVTASIYVNADNEVTALFITNIADKAGAPTKATSTTSVTYKKDGSTATPTWAANDTVQFVSTPTSRAAAGVAFNLTFKYNGTAWAVNTGAGSHSEPTGWDYAFDGVDLTLTAKTAGSGKADPLAGNITVTVTNSASTVNGADAGASDFDDGTGEAEPPEVPVVKSAAATIGSITYDDTAKGTINVAGDDPSANPAKGATVTITLADATVTKNNVTVTNENTSDFTVAIGEVTEANGKKTITLTIAAVAETASENKTFTVKVAAADTENYKDTEVSAITVKIADKPT